MKKAVTWGLAISYIILFIAMGVMGIKILVLVNKCVGNIYSTIYRCWYPQIFIR